LSFIPKKHDIQTINKTVKVATVVYSYLSFNVNKLHCLKIFRVWMRDALPVGQAIASKTKKTKKT